MKKNLISKVEELYKAGCSTSQIAKKLGITNYSVGAYKAHITRKNKNGNGHEQYSFEKYSKSFIFLDPRKIVEKLDEEEISQLENILEKLNYQKRTQKPKSNNKKIKKNYSQKMPDLSPSEIREKIIELKKQNKTNEQIYREFPKNLKRILASYIAHFTMGTYHERGLV